MYSHAQLHRVNPFLQVLQYRGVAHPFGGLNRYRFWTSPPMLLRFFYLRLRFPFLSFLLARITTHSSNLTEVFELFSSGLFAAVSYGLTVASCCRLRKSGVDFAAGGGAVLASLANEVFSSLYPHYLSLLFLSLATPRPREYSNDLR